MNSSFPRTPTFFVRVFLVIFITLASAQCLWAQSEKPVVKIGAIIPLTGSMAFAGEEIRDAMTLATEELGNTSFTYKLLFEDNALELAKSVSAAQKLLNVDNVDAVVTLWPPTANVVAPLTDAKKVLHYTIAWDPSIAKTHPSVLSHQAMVDAFAGATLKLLKQQGCKRLAFLQLNESGFNVGTEFVKSLAPSYGIDLVDLDLFNSGERDFRSEILRIKTKQPDTVLVWAVQPEMDIILRQLHEIAPTLHVTGFFDVVQNLSSIEGKPFLSEVSGTNAFHDKFKKHFGKDFQLKAPNAYDIVHLIVDAYEQSPRAKPNLEELKRRITHVRNYSGAVGVFSVDDWGNSSYPVVEKVVKDGKLVSLLP